jgi:hypothetical protein
MGMIIPFVRDSVRDSAFEPHEIAAMSTALDEVCKVLKLDGDGSAKEIMGAHR